MDDGGGASFSVVYFDGHTEANVGEVTVDSSLNFNKFLSFLSQKIGMSPHKFSVYLTTFGTNQRIPITGKFNFASIARENAAASFFFVERSKRPRSRKNKSNKGASRNGKNAFTDNEMLLRRDDAVMGQILGRVEYEKWVSGLQLERERFHMSMGMRLGGGRIHCEECLTGDDDGFHLCVYDAVTVGFRSPAGPVARPVKGSG